MNITDLKQIFRHLYRKKLYTAINILGLGIGLGCVILMSTYIIHEFSFDRYHSKSSRIYRLIDGKECATYYAMGAEFKNDVPEIENTFSVYPIYDLRIKQNQDFISEKNMLLSDPEIFNMLDIKILVGDKKYQLPEPNTLCISDKMAQKYFPERDPVGEYLQVALYNKIFNLRITGVFKSFPSYSSIRADFIGDISMSFSMLWDVTYSLGLRPDRAAVYDFRHEWNRNEFRTFVLLKPNTKREIVENKCSAICLKHRNDNPDGGIHLQPVTDMYLHSQNLRETEPFLVSQMSSLRIFAAIGLLILLVACINFILISNADNELSIIEIACRKVNGASKKQILATSLLKSTIVSFISLIPALLFVAISIPFFNTHFQKNLDVDLFLKLPYIVSFIAITLLTGVIAGLYLGVITYSTNPVALFRKGTVTRKGRFLKGSVIIIQFVVFILLTTCLIIMEKQFQYSLHKDLGFTTNNVMVVDLNDNSIKDKVNAVRDEIITDPNVAECLPSSFVIPPSDDVLNISYKDIVTGKSMEQESIVLGQGVIELLKMTMLEGNSFNEANSKDRNNIIINEAAAQKYKLKAGDRISKFNVIGIVKNFHYHSIHQPVNPLFIFAQHSGFPFLIIKTNGHNTEVAEHLRKICENLAPDYFFKKEMLNDRIEAFYSKEKNQMGMIGFFTLVTLFLSVMGLFGFVSLNLLKRTKEIGIRKINGAKSGELVNMLNILYIRWVTFAFVLACPVAWYVMHKWLQNFAYKTELSWWIFALAGLMTTSIILITVSWQSWLAATRNPVEALRYE